MEELREEHHRDKVLPNLVRTLDPSGLIGFLDWD